MVNLSPTDLSVSQGRSKEQEIGNKKFQTQPEKQ